MHFYVLKNYYFFSSYFFLTQLSSKERGQGLTANKVSEFMRPGKKIGTYVIRHKEDKNGVQEVI